jgi:hypothetical protein
MIKDVLVNLPVEGSRDVVTSFAVSVAARFGAHLTGIAFLYEPLMPVMVDMYGVPPAIIESQRIENEKAAKAAVARFEEAARLADISGEARALDASVGAAPSTLARIARRFDLSVIAQPEPNQPALSRVFVEAALFASGSSET